MPGLHTLDGPGDTGRVFARQTQSGTRIAAAQTTEGRDEIAIDSATGEGSGLGLAIARDAAARLGGAIGLYERPEELGPVFRYQQRCSPRDQ